MAKDTIGSMVAVVSATAGQFDADLKKAAGSLTRFKKHADGLSDSGGGLGGLFAAGGAIGAGIAAVQTAISAVTGTVQKFFDTIEQAEHLGDFASQIGATVEELSGLRFAADISGSSAEALDAGLAKMVQQLGEARGGAAETRAAFEALGLNVDALSRKSAGEAFKDIADAFQNIKSPADQAALAVDIFGKQGTKLINVLKGGSEGVDKLIARGKELGAVLGTEDAAALVVAKDKIDEMKTAWQGLWDQLTILVLPVLKVIVSVLTTLVSGMQEVINVFSGKRGSIFADPEPIRQTAKAIEDTGSVLEEFKRKAKEAADAQKVLDDAMRRGVQIAQSVRTPFEIFDDTLDDLNKLLKVGAINWRTYERAIAKASDELEKATEAKENLDRFKETPGVGAVQAGTTAAFSAIQASARAQAAAERRQVEQNERQIAELKRQTDIQNRTLQAITRGGVIVNGAAL